MTSGRPGPVLVDITKDAQLGKCEFDWDGRRAVISASLCAAGSFERPLSIHWS